MRETESACTSKAVRTNQYQLALVLQLQIVCQNPGWQQWDPLMNATPSTLFHLCCGNM